MAIHDVVKMAFNKKTKFSRNACINIAVHRWPQSDETPTNLTDKLCVNGKKKPLGGAVHVENRTDNNSSCVCLWKRVQS